MPWRPHQEPALTRSNATKKVRRKRWDTLRNCSLSQRLRRAIEEQLFLKQLRQKCRLDLLQTA